MATKRKTKTTYPDFAAAFSDADVETLETRAKAFGVNRRVVLHMLHLNREQLIKGANGNCAPDASAEALTIMINAVAGYESHLTEMLEMTRAAHARALAAAQTMLDLDMVAA